MSTIDANMRNIFKIRRDFHMNRVSIIKTGQVVFAKWLLLSVISLVAIIMHGGAFAGSVSKHFSDYVDITPTRHSSPAIFRTHYFAKQKVNDRAHDPLYKNNQWKLVMRRGIYLAQVDKAMSEMYRYFLGYSTDVDIVEENGDFYIARRKFKSFKKAYNPGRTEPEYLRKDGTQFLVGGFLLLDDGRLIKDNQEKKFKGLASIAVLTKFFGETDAEDFNFGFQVSDYEITAIFYDCEHALDFDSGEGRSEANIETELTKKYGNEFVNMSWFQQEKKQMMQKIADTDFSVIETILRKNITGSSLDEARWLFNKILNDPTVLPDYDRAEARAKLDEVNKMDDKDNGIEQIIQQMRIRHEKLREQLAVQHR